MRKWINIKENGYPKEGDKKIYLFAQWESCYHKPIQEYIGTGEDRVHFREYSNFTHYMEVKKPELLTNKTDNNV